MLRHLAGTYHSLDAMTPDEPWQSVIAAIQSSRDPEGLRALGHQLWQISQSQPDGMSRLGALARRDSKIATALQATLLFQGRLVADIVGWDHLANTWCRLADGGDPWDEWARQAVIAAITDRALSTDEGWKLIGMLLAAAPNNKVLGIIGAGPLEDLLSADPYAVAQRIEVEALTNARLRYALWHLWQSNTPDDVFARVKQFADPEGGTGWKRP